MIDVPRDKKGRWSKGASGNPKGRPPRETEERIRQVISEAMSDADIRRIFKAAIKGALAGDKTDREFVARYSFPRPTEYQDVSIGVRPEVALEFPTVIEPEQLPAHAIDPDNPTADL